MEESGGSYSFIDEPLYLYRRHDGGISQGGNGNRAAVYSLLAHIEAYKRRMTNKFTPNITEQEYITNLFYFINVVRILPE